uniref:thiol oxidase n=1 Tax=viral metagenome TaxID=1070528 RepID=A0A6C0J7D8_9ZZZZ
MIESTIWGPSLWYLIHTLSYTYDKNHKIHYQDFFNYLKIIIPCPVCREHYQSYITKTPIILDDKNDIINWCFIFHNAVNKRLDNKSISIETCNTLYKKVDNRIILNFLKIIMKEHIDHLFIFKKFLLILLKIYPDKNIRNQNNINKIKNAKGIQFLFEINNLYKLLGN